MTASFRKRSTNNDLYIVAQAEYRAGVEGRCNVLLESMVAHKPLPAERSRGNVYRTPIFQREIAHRKATQKRDIDGTLFKLIQSIGGFDDGDDAAHAPRLLAELAT